MTYQRASGNGEAIFEILPERHSRQSRVPGAAIHFEPCGGDFRLLPAILRPVKFAENAEGIIPKFKHKT